MGVVTQFVAAVLALACIVVGARIAPYTFPRVDRPAHLASELLAS